MGRKCYVPDCLSEEGREEDRGVTFHKIPLHADIRPKWLGLCRVPENKHNFKVIHVCSRHFLKVDFCNFKGRKYMLRQGVLPSVFPWSKLKKEATDPNINPIKSEFDSPAESIHSEMDCDTIIKSEIKDEPTDVGDESFQIKEEVLPIRQDDSYITLPSDNSVSKPKQLPLIQKHSTTIEQKGKSIETSSGLLNFAVNTQLEALDFNQMWFPAHIVEIDYEENEVLIHFEKYSSKYDEWISMNSSRLRPLQSLPKKILPVETFVVGEKVMASWSDARKFAATVTKVIDQDTYEVVFNDGFVKVLKGHRMAKSYGRVVGSSPLFDPVKGTKQDRRDKKRKINVAQLFRKRMKTDASEELSSPNVSEVNVSNSEEFDGWLPKWENGRPIGVDSVIEAPDGIRKSVIIPDPRLPPNWTRHLSQRLLGASAGKWDSVVVSPEGRKFRTRAEIKAFLDENPGLNFNDTMFDFTIHRRSRGRRVQHVVDVPQQIEPVAHAVVDNPNSLKILLVDDAYKCPIEGCEKSFRRENLAQMHVKHYHPKFTKFLDSTPNVADLAYARTVGDSLDKSPDRIAKLLPATRPVQKTVTPKTSAAKLPQLSPTSESETKTSQLSESQGNLLQKTKDSEILKLLNSKPSDGEQSPKFPPGLPTNMYPPIQLKDLLVKSEGIPKREDINIKSLSASTTRPTGIKTLLPVVRTNDSKIKDAKLEDNKPTETKTCNKPGNRYHLKRKRFTSDTTEISKSIDKEPPPEPLVPVVIQEQPPQPDTKPNYIVEGGEVIKIVRMKREEIINCTCGITEEDGLMIQCELCLCWQHAYCNNIQRENEVPEKYICYICQNPMRQRSSRKYFHDQDWLKNGTLPTGNYHCKDVEALKKRFELLKKSHDLSGLLVELTDYMHSLKVKLKIAETKNHQKLYLWSKPWEKLPLPEKLEVKDEGGKVKLTKSDLDLLSANKVDSQNDPSLYSILKSPNNLEVPIPAPIIPQPEAAIDSSDCKLNLLDHISHSQSLMEERLNMIEAQVDALDTATSKSNEDFNHTCETVQMLLRDLGTLQELSHSNSL